MEHLGRSRHPQCEHSYWQFPCVENSLFFFSIYFLISKKWSFHLLSDSKTGSQHLEYVWWSTFCVPFLIYSRIKMRRNLSKISTYILTRYILYQPESICYAAMNAKTSDRFRLHLFFMPSTVYQKRPNLCYFISLWK